MVGYDSEFPSNFDLLDGISVQHKMLDGITDARFSGSSFWTECWSETHLPTNNPHFPSNMRWTEIAGFPAVLLLHYGMLYHDDLLIVLFSNVMWHESVVLSKGTNPIGKNPNCLTFKKQIGDMEMGLMLYTQFLYAYIYA
uniref:Uncharacterized protein n=1 Tax=Ipomoea trifida TaxID=35884 RepID=A0A8Y4_IPOTF|nr:hypothetical protein [Ipomoea trifida]